VLGCVAIRLTNGDGMRKVVLQCVAACCSVLQCIAVCCRVLLVSMMYFSPSDAPKKTRCGKWCGSVLQCVAVCCSVLQCVAVCCSVLQGVACVVNVFLAIRRTKGDAMRKVVSLDDLKRVTTSIEELQESLHDVAGMQSVLFYKIQVFCEFI